MAACPMHDIAEFRRARKKQSASLSPFSPAVFHFHIWLPGIEPLFVESEVQTNDRLRLVNGQLRSCSEWAKVFTKDFRCNSGLTSRA